MPGRGPTSVTRGTAKGRNRHHASRLALLRNWHHSPGLDSAAMLGFKLYLWHKHPGHRRNAPLSGGCVPMVVGAMAELQAPVFAFGAKWFEILERSLAPTPVAQGKDYGSEVPSARSPSIETTPRAVRGQTRPRQGHPPAHPSGFRRDDDRLGGRDPDAPGKQRARCRARRHRQRPTGDPSRLKVSGRDGARLLCLHTPGCCQDFYFDASEPIEIGDALGVDAGPVNMGRVQASAARNGGIEILGPPPFDGAAQR